MRRLLVGVTAIVAVAVATIVLSHGRDDASYRVAAIFDTAHAIRPGQNVKVAGVKVGTVSGVHLLRTAGGGYKARIDMTIPRRDGPFRSDASCRILPEGLISEDFVECDPGTAPRALRAFGGAPPTVQVAHTTAPLSLQDVLDTFKAPTNEYVQIVLNELGLATAGRGADLSAIIRRANPMLTRARDVLAILGRQRKKIADAVGDTDRVLTDLDSRREAITRFVGSAADVAETTGSRSSSVSASIAKLPPLLNALDRSLKPIQVATKAGTPLLGQLRAAAPSLRRAVTASIGEFTAAATPAVKSLGSAGAQLRPALRRARPTLRHLDVFTKRGAPTIDSLAKLLTSSRDAGAFESLMYFLYSFGSAVAPYDATSHFAVVGPMVFPGCILANLEPGTQVKAGCSHAFTAPGRGRIPPSATSGIGGTEAQQMNKIRGFLDYLLK